MPEDQDHGPSLARILFLAAGAAAVVLPLRAYVGEPISIASGSMEPTLAVGEHVLLDKLTLRSRPPRRGEIVIFRCPVGDHGDMGKRVIGLPGETVELRAKAVYIDGRRLDEPYTQHTRAGERLDGDDLGPLTVPQDAIFVLGDNRDQSDDSSVWRDQSGRRVPFVPLRDVRGLVRGFGLD